MIWFNIKELENKLTEGSLSDKEGFNYLLGNFVMFTLSSYFSSDYESKWFTWIEAASSTFIIVVLLRTTFSINSNGDGQDYFKRFLSLFFVNGIRLIIYAVIAIVPISIVLIALLKYPIRDQIENDILTLFMEIIFAIVYYFMITNSFKRITGHRIKSS